VGRTTHTEIERRNFFDPEDVIEEVLQQLQRANATDVITFSGSGEPTLNKDLGYMLRELKRKTVTPLAVITNGSLLFREDVCEDLLSADIVLPSLDAVSEETFARINRPHPSISVDTVVKGLRTFRSAYKGQIWLEIMFVRCLNDTLEELEKFSKVLQCVSMDKIQLNTITRPAPDKVAEPVDQSRLADISRMLGSRCEIISGFDKRSEALGINDWVARVLDILARRALTVDDVARVTGVSQNEAEERLMSLAEQQLLQVVDQGGTLFYVQKEAQGELV
jgi:wyosine [tRNA(Phe)-imidazoG37] synthetase (radical SAM superfamily)